MIEPTIQAKWKKLMMVNYPVDPQILKPYLPYDTELALWNNRSYVSLVGFLFLDVKLGGISVPLHTNFVEINLRFYVRRNYKGEWRYGVVFLKEIVALPMVTFIANTFVNEHYETMIVRHKLSKNQNGIFLNYKWKKKEWNSIEINCYPELKEIAKGSQEHFFTAQHWGYTKLKDDKSREYSVEHPDWKIYDTKDYKINVDYGKVFGKEFAFLDDQHPESVFLAEGSEIIMRKGETISGKKNTF